MQGQLDALAASCGAMTAAVAATKGGTAGLLAEADRLSRALSQVEARRQMVADFLAQYQLSPEEVRGGGAGVWCLVLGGWGRG